MTAHVTRCALLALAMLGCTESHAPAPGASCTLDGDGGTDCPAGMYCALESHVTGARQCRVLCDPGTRLAPHRRCDTGEVCTRTLEPPPAEDPPTCWLGRPDAEAEGGPCRAVSHCDTGLWCAEDLSVPDATGGTCEPVCNDDSHCTRPGEVCIEGHYCALPCDPGTPSTCPDDSICIAGFCVWAERAADCDRDGALDCELGLVCSGLTPELCYAPTEYPLPFWP